MKSHLVMMFAFSVLTSLTLSFITKNCFRERLKYFLYLLGSFILLSILGGWLMYPFPF